MNQPTEQKPGAIEQAVQNLIDALKPAAKTYIEAVAWLMKTLAKAGVTTDNLREHQAIRDGKRYWQDTKQQPRRTPGHQPLIHNGRKPR